MSYADLLAAAQENPVEADFHALRMAYAQSEDYAPYTHDTDNVELLSHALRADDLSAALTAVLNLLQFNYLDIEAHMSADYIYTRQDDAPHAAFHRAFAQGLLRSIIESGTGRDFSTAFIVISVPEEYTLLRVMGLRHSSQSLSNHDGHWYDVLDVTNAAGQAAKVYFNIDLPRNWLQRNLTGG